MVNILNIALFNICRSKIKLLNSSNEELKDYLKSNKQLFGKDNLFRDLQ